MLVSKPMFARQGKKSYVFSQSTAMHGISGAITDIMKPFAVNHSNGAMSSVAAITPIPQALKDEVSQAAGAPFTCHEEGFVIQAAGDGYKIYADTTAGIIAGCMTFLQCLDDKRHMHYDLLWDYPFSKVRGVKVYMPGRNGIQFFKSFIDQMVYFRNNTLMLEIGGAMEYKRHPGINQKWEEYCEFMSEYPGKANEIQGLTGKWFKNSIHFENGEGSYLTQDETRDLAKYCADRGVEIIPEVPCTSHCDYMLNYRPDLAERPDDPYPDTFCPSNPGSYELLWDILDEVIEVFNPKIINIGHDEYYSIGVCEVCKQRDAAELLNEDITKIYDYLKSKGVRTMFWADKLLNMTSENGCGFGGAEIKMHKNWNLEKEFWGIIPATWRAIDMVPKDIVCLNWSWGYHGSDETYREHGFPVVYGNFSGTEMLHYRTRVKDNVSGGIQSNWSVSNEVYLQRNGIYFEMAYDNILFWDKDFKDANFLDYAKTSFETLYRYKNRNVLNEPPGSNIQITHTTDRFIQNKYYTSELLDPARYAMGHYLVTYKDGTTANLPIVYGENISGDSIVWLDPPVHDTQSWLDRTQNDKIRFVSPSIRSIAYTTVPVNVDGKVWYTYTAKNPHPEKTIASLEYVPPEGADWTVTTQNWEAV